MTPVKAPDYCLQNSGVRTQREWRTYKRRHLKEAQRAMRTLLLGAAYTPKISGIYIVLMCDQLRQLEQAWSQKAWGK